MAVGPVVDKAAVSAAISQDAARMGWDEYSWLKKRSIQWHTQLGQDQATMKAALNALGFSDADAAAVLQVIANIDVLVALVEGNVVTAAVNPGTGHPMVPDFAKVQGLA